MSKTFCVNKEVMLSKSGELSPQGLGKLQDVQGFLFQQRHDAFKNVELSQQGIGKRQNVQQSGLSDPYQVIKKSTCPSSWPNLVLHVTSEMLCLSAQGNVEMYL